MRIVILQVMQQTDGKVIWLGLNLGKNCRKKKKYSETAPKFWLYGRGWDQNDWAVKEYPTKKKLDELFPNRPVYLKELMVTLPLPIKKLWI